MSVSSFLEYSQKITAIIATVLADAKTVLDHLEIDERSVRYGFIAGILRFDDGSTLHFREFVDMSKPEPLLMYVYHYQDSRKQLIFRYDNAKHRPSLGTLEHKHTPNGVIECHPPSFEAIIDEIMEMVGLGY
ncbi:MAG: hypothetical protein GXP38_02340 [Chloroflexi bacterium]|nr:hypothetical protein [Chloroflexota bacterium]